MNNTIPVRDDIVLHAEQCYLGACLLDDRAYSDSGPLDESDFSDTRHQRIFDAIRTVMKHEGEISPITVARCLPAVSRDPLLLYMQDLLESTPTATTAVHYAEFVRDHAKLRRALVHLNAAQSSGISGTLDDAHSRILLAIEAARSALEAEDSGIDADEMLRLSDTAVAGNSRPVSTTIPSLDNVLGGLSGPRIYVLGSRPSVGKSLIAGQIAINATEHGDRRIGIISLEMSGPQIMRRMKAYLGRSPRAGLPLWCSSVCDLDAIVSQIRQWRGQKAIDLAILDYVQLVKAPQYRARYEEVGAVSRGLKRLGMTLGIPILVLAQLSREHLKAGRRPGLGDLRECGDIEQDADVVMLLHHPEEPGNVTQLAVAKNRDGAAGLVVDLEFSPARLGLAERLG